MLELTNLEVSALSEIARQHPELLAQISVLTVLERRNSGVGFFTEVAVDRSSAERVDSKNPLGNIWLDIQGFESPMVFLVFLEDGFIKFLEGATVGDQTDQIDLHSLVSEGLHKA